MRFAPLLLMMGLVAFCPRSAVAQRSGLGNGSDLELTTRIASMAASSGAKLVATGQLFSLSISSPLGGLTGQPYLLAIDLRPKDDFSGALDLPGEPDVCGVSAQAFFLVDGTTVSPAVIPGVAEVDGVQSSVSITLPNLAGLHPNSIWVQALASDPTAPNGVAFSKTVRHDTDLLASGTTYSPPEVSPSAYAGYGFEMADLEGDGRAEVLVGMPQADPLGVSNAGEVRVLDGVTQAVLRTLRAPTLQANSWFGSTVRVADVNGDGHEDLLIGARLEDVSGQTDAGAAYIFYGPGFSTSRRLVSTSPYLQTRFGYTLTTCDWNWDGLRDLVVGAPRAPGANLAQSGQVEIFDGSTGVWMATLESPTPQALAKFGYGLVAADFDGDGREELAVGEPFFDFTGNQDDTGRIHVFTAGNVQAIRSLALGGFDQDEVLGHVLDVGDLNDDGVMDLVAGAEFRDGAAVDSGAVVVFWGPDFSQVREISPPTLAAAEGFGSDVTVADVNADGIVDLVVGAFYASELGLGHAGAGYILLGPGFDQFKRVAASAPLSNAEFGRRCATADTDGDGFAEVGFSAPYSGGSGQVREGSVSIFR